MTRAGSPRQHVAWGERLGQDTPPAESLRSLMPDLVDRTLSLRWLASARRATLAAQLALMFFAEAGTQIHIHSPALIVILLGWGAADVFQAAWFRRRPPPARLIGVSAAIDLAALTGMLVLSGG